MREFEEDMYVYQYDDYPMELSDESCTVSVLRQSLFSFVCLFGAAALCLVVRNFRHVECRAICYVIIGHLLVYQFSSDFWGIFGFLTLATVSGLIMIKTNVRGNYILFSQIAFITLFQFMFGTEYMLSVRGIMMLHVMRVTAIGFDMEYEKNKLSIASLMEFFYFPPVMIMGPFLEPRVFAGFQDSFDFTKTFTKVTSTVYWICASLIALLVSGCYLDMINPPNVFVEDFLVALSFRASHYFVSFLAQAVITFILFEENVEVTSFTEIEWPRSVATIVTNWNIPMHSYLKEYIFSIGVVSSSCSYAFYTFLVSGLLHGYDPQILVTLLTLGFIAFAETKFRKKLAARLYMCVKSKECYVCNHDNGGLIEQCINFIFKLLAMYHLVFTGMPFVNHYAGTGYSLEHIFATYGNHYYASFVISTLLLVFSMLL